MVNNFIAMKILGLLLLLALTLSACRPVAPKQTSQLNDGLSKLAAMDGKRGPGWEYEIVLDKNEQILEEGWKFHPVPDRYATHGIDHLKPYLEKLLASNNWFSTVSISTPNRGAALSLFKMDGQLTIDLAIDWRREIGREKQARAFFTKRGIKPMQDYLAGNGDGEDATRVLNWPVSGDAKTLAALVKKVAVELCGIPENSGLDIAFEEHLDERGKHDAEGEISILSTGLRGTLPDTTPK
jgi:hypothetical protein